MQSAVLYFVPRSSPLQIFFVHVSISTNCSIRFFLFVGCNLSRFASCFFFFSLFFSGLIGFGLHYIGLVAPSAPFDNRFFCLCVF